METIEELYIKYYSRLCLYATSILGDPNNAEDAVQATFLKFINNEEESATYEHVSLPYLYTSVRNTCISIIRKENSHNKYLEMSVDTYIENPFDEKLIKAELIAILTGILDSLPEGCARILKMSYIDGLKHKEIAEKLNLSINTVKSQKTRGLMLLKEKVSIHFLISLLIFLKKF